ncbi:hypothetical protein [Streptosporangium saharense]|uniref:Uncharacterized protein n=1 Tax=Streptosporangium saharense TaxID=1706840 RepID=A0A7W7QWE1_9ACTN|nr:hypothetical protein [Streptosporangium saharense]MBB4920972.1 hypothetical protein [Streptosporangium saharense]
MTVPANDKPFQVPWQELARRAAATSQPDMTPLSPSDRDKLRRRLDAPGGWRLALTPREYAEYCNMGVVRSPEAVAQVEAVNREDLAQYRADGVQPGHEDWGLQQYTEGVLAALTWATGRALKAPLSGVQTARPSHEQMWAEATLGEEIARGQRASTLHRSYGTGVEAALLWLIARSDDPPI